MSGIETIVPFYGDDRQRHANMNAVMEHLRKGYDNPVWGHIDAYPIWVEADISPGAARNRGAENVVSPLILFNDADSIVPWPQIVEAGELAMKADGLVFAYDIYVRLARDEKPPHDFDDLPSILVERIIDNSGSAGCIAISRACFEQVGGFDEEYVGWGYEDLDFARRCNTLWPNRRVAGPLYHLWHGGRHIDDDSPLDADLLLVERNRERWASTA